MVCIRVPQSDTDYAVTVSSFSFGTDINIHRMTLKDARYLLDCLAGSIETMAKAERRKEAAISRQSPTDTAAAPEGPQIEAGTPQEASHATAD
tara:strand:- start:217 stop:495 length:279 start_codon:yes stop_codon:yes gene_type:complete